MFVQCVGFLLRAVEALSLESRMRWGYFFVFIQSNFSSRYTPILKQSEPFFRRPIIPKCSGEKRRPERVSNRAAKAKAKGKAKSQPKSTAKGRKRDD